ncbi:S-type pyocin domain-containing protein, partial [Chimaeribacter arupi]
EEEQPVTIIWTPDRSGVHVPTNTGNPNPPKLPNPVMVNPLPDSTGLRATTSPSPDEKSFADYILILPVADIPPIYIYLSKPPVEFLEVKPYRDFNGRSRQGHYHVDHMPSRQAVILYLRRKHPDLRDKQIKEMADQVAAIAIPEKVHRQESATYGGRNRSQMEFDSYNLRAAINKDFDQIKPILLEEYGATEAELDACREEMHRINTELGIYK